MQNLKTCVFIKEKNFVEDQSIDDNKIFSELSSFFWTVKKRMSQAVCKNGDKLYT